MRLVFDIETDGLDYSKIWLIAAVDIDTGEEYIFTDHDDNYPNLEEFKTLFDKATMLIGHNTISFDFPAIKKITGWTPGDGIKLIDTMILSQLNDFYRPSLDEFKPLSKKGNHAMATWAMAFGDLKQDDPAWDVWSHEMLTRCVSDVHLNVKMYKYIMMEVKNIKKSSPDYARAIRLEHEFAQIMAEQYENGWLFYDAKARNLIRKIDVRMAEIEMEVEPLLPQKTVYIDMSMRVPKILKDGRYDRITREYFGVEYAPNPKVPERYQRSKIVDQTLGQNSAVIDFLLSQGWKPTEWTKKKDENGKWKNVSPKLTEDSYDSITGEYGQMVAEWRTLRSRKGLLEGLLKLQREDGRIGCDAFVIGTNTFRCRHRGIVNIPGAFAHLGKEVRECFGVEEGRTLVSADSSGNQLRAMCHYIGNRELSEAVTDGDVHQRNADIVGVPRNIVKNVTYALMFGAGDAKLGKTAGKRSEGKAIRAKMMHALDGLEPFLEKLRIEHEENHFDTGRGYVLGLDGRRVYCEDHKAFNALLQCFEAVICKAACVEADRLIKSEGLDAKIVCHYHDEFTYDVAKEDAERVAEILKYSLGEFVTKHYDLTIRMDGDPAIGGTWYDVH